jgi:hypothetical protein
MTVNKISLVGLWCGYPRSDVERVLSIVILLISVISAVIAIKKIEVKLNEVIGDDQYQNLDHFFQLF